MRLKTCGMLWITGLICANDAVNKFAPVFRNGCLWLPKNTVFQLFLHLVSVTWPVGHVTYWLERAISRHLRRRSRPPALEQLDRHGVSLMSIDYPSTAIRAWAGPS